MCTSVIASLRLAFTSPSCPLQAIALMVIGVLAEKERTVPDTYPLTLNALVAGCNQKTSRDPVIDVSEAEACRGSATLIAREIRARVREEVGITLSTGVAPNKFVAKVASDWNKPDGMWVVTPAQVGAFVRELWVPLGTPLALRIVWQLAQAVDVPVVGIGGIFTADDAMDFLVAGASAFHRPQSTANISCNVYHPSSVTGASGMPGP